MSDLRTERLLLHAFTPGTAARVEAGEPGPGDHWVAGYPGPGEQRATRNFLNRCQDGATPHPFGNYEIRRREDGAALGGIGFHGAPDAVGSVTIGYGLAESARGHGYATEAVRAIAEHCRAQGVVTLRAGTDPDNLASQNVLRKAGFTLVREGEEGPEFELALADGAKIVTYLELAAPDALRPGPEVAGLAVREVEGGSAENREARERVGGPYGWSSARRTEEQWRQSLAERPGRRFWMITRQGETVGILETEPHPDGSVEIGAFGLLPEYVGQGLGAATLTLALRTAWATEPATTRVVLDTCTKDHPNALGNYLARGMTVYRTETGHKRVAA
ncbi:GNAT family N-acetyltransferase [Kitasatospora sp. NPDC096147]|uniref:GNAT family N-acetyltransferase n=1 Tax=Kitasatospora sp. NPDC096147 TaxID=3364093 RepID=UPI0037F9757C